MLTLSIQLVATSLQVGFDNAMKNKSANGSGVGVLFQPFHDDGGWPFMYLLLLYLTFFFPSWAMPWTDEIWGYIDLSGI